MAWFLLSYLGCVLITRFGVTLTGEPPFTRAQLWLLAFFWPGLVLKVIMATIDGTGTWRRY